MAAVMAAAMTLPTVVPAVQHVALNSFRDREWQAVAEFVSVYLAIWVLFTATASVATSTVAAVAGPWTLAAIVLTLGGVYERTRWKRRALTRCHRATPLPPRGPRATVGVCRFAWIHASGCVGSCWAPMVAMLVLPNAQVLAALGLATLMTYQKFTRRPRRGARHGSWILAASAAAAATAALTT